MLNRLALDADTFYNILDSYKSYIDYEDISPYITKGYENKSRIKFDTNTNTFICQAYRLNYIANRQVVNASDDWKQIICVMNNDLDSAEDIKELLYARKANSYMKAILRKYYTDAEIEECLNTHSVEKGKQRHSRLPLIFSNGEIYKFTNCVYYDINGAHCDALREIFPKAESDILWLYNNRDNPDIQLNLKNLVNIYVGDLVNNGHRGTFEWIVARTRKMIDDITSRANGIVLYCNTDGAIILDPQNKLEVSNELGKFKSEIDDDVIYAYRSLTGTSYTIYQYYKNGKKIIKGDCRNRFRNNIDLSKGVVTHYKINRVNNIEDYTNIETITKEIING